MSIQSHTKPPARERPPGVFVRLDPAIRARLENLPHVGPYRLTITQVVERGIKLALAELDAKAKGPEQ